MSVAKVPGAVLFACGLNRIRSPMAAGLMRRLHGPGMVVESCGVHVDPDGLPDPFVATVMDEIGVDVGGHAPRTFEDLEGLSFDLIVSLSPEAHRRAIEVAGDRPVELAFWPATDPTLTTGSRETILAAYRSVRDDLDRLIRERLSLAT